MSKADYDLVCDECRSKIWIGTVPATDRSETNERFYVHQATQAGTPLTLFLMKHVTHPLRCVTSQNQITDEYQNEENS